MPRPAALIQLEINQYETLLQAPPVKMVASDGTTYQNYDLMETRKALAECYADLDRANGATLSVDDRFSRMRVTGIGTV